MGCLLTFVLAVGTLAGCTTGTGGNEPAEPTPTHTRAAGGDAPTLWERTVSRLGPDGRLGKDAALAAYTLAFGPLPGVERPKGDPGEIASGTFALTSVLAHWNELTPEQRAVISGAHTGGGAAARATPAPIKDCHASDSADAGPYRAMVNDAIAKIAPKYGPLRRVRVTVVRDPYDDPKKDGWDAYASPCTGLRLTPSGQQITSCTIHVRPVGDLGHKPSDEVRAYMIHEAMHCFQFDKFGPAEFGHPAWYSEGLPTWAASVLGPPTQYVSGWWHRYASLGGVVLDDLTYAGMGFFVQHASLGLDTWAMAKQLGPGFGNAGTAGTTAALRAAHLPEAFLNSWGSGFVQGRYPGTSWTAVGPNLPQVSSRIVPAGTVTDGGSPFTRKVPAAGAEAISVNIAAEVVQIYPGVNALGRISLGYDGTDATLDVAQSMPYCTLDSWRCKCPEDSALAGTKFGLMEDGQQYVGLTGGPVAASVSISGMTRDEFCGPPAKAEKWRAVSVKSRSTLPQGVGGDWHWNIDGGAGIKLAIDKQGNVSVDYSGMRKLSYTIPEVRQAGTIVCSGVDKGSLPAKSFTGRTGRWQPTIGTIGSTGTIDVTSPTRLHQSAPPGSGGCRSIFRADPFHAGIWKRTPTSLTITATESSPAGGTINTVWTFAPA